MFSMRRLLRRLLWVALFLPQTGCVGDLLDDGGASRPRPKPRGVYAHPGAIVDFPPPTNPIEPRAVVDAGGDRPASSTGWEPIGSSGPIDPPLAPDTAPPPIEWTSPHLTANPPLSPLSPAPIDPSPYAPPPPPPPPSQAHATSGLPPPGHSNGARTSVNVGTSQPPPTPPPPTPLVAGPQPSSIPALPPGAMAAGTSDSDPLYYDFMGKEVPDVSSDGVWAVRGVSDSLAGMKGQVVFLMFAFQTCPSCGLMTPYLKQWHEMFGQQGLQVVYVNNGLMANFDAVHKAIVDQHLLFAYFHDAKGTTLASFGVRSFPTAYLINRAGKVVWEGPPIANEAPIQEKILQLLAEK
jgi:hypothetical protein